MEAKDFRWIEDDKYSWVPGKVIGESTGEFRVEIDIDGEIICKSVRKSIANSVVHPSCLRI